jgi:hypothetical protein
VAVFVCAEGKVWRTYAAGYVWVAVHQGTFGVAVPRVSLV